MTRKMAYYLRGLLPLSLVLVLALIGCAQPSPAPTSNATTPTPGQLPSGATPSITITSPADGSTVAPGDVMVTVNVSNFNLVPKQGEAAVQGEGHIHYFLDVNPIPTTPGQPALPPAGSAYATTDKTTYTFTNVAAGTHTIAVELVNNDHTPLSPPVTATVTVTVTGTTSTATTTPGYTPPATTSPTTPGY